MKVIDLLNKIAKGEKFDNCKIKFKEIEPEEVSEYFLFDRLYEDDLNLNDEIEIIEEEKDIKKILIEKHWDKQGDCYIEENDFKYYTAPLIIEKINELIDIVKELKNEKENNKKSK